jgi:hypothetical protein
MRNAVLYAGAGRMAADYYDQWSCLPSGALAIFLFNVAQFKTLLVISEFEPN